MRFELCVLHGSFARQALRVNLWELLNDGKRVRPVQDMQQELRTAFSEHLVLVFMHQCLTKDKLTS
ncbi:MAG: hypothetical protein ACI9DC_001331 [Gammaproteobacteria bacterium]|jgi:hypothetical protein